MGISRSNCMVLCLSTSNHSVYIYPRNLLCISLFAIQVNFTNQLFGFSPGAQRGCGSSNVRSGTLLRPNPRSLSPLQIPKHRHRTSYMGAVCRHSKMMGEDQEGSFVLRMDTPVAAYSPPYKTLTTALVVSLFSSHPPNCYKPDCSAHMSISVVFHLRQNAIAPECIDSILASSKPAQSE